MKSPKEASNGLYSPDLASCAAGIWSSTPGWPSRLQERLFFAIRIFARFLALLLLIYVLVYAQPQHRQSDIQVRQNVNIPAHKAWGFEVGMRICGVRRNVTVHPPRAIVILSAAKNLFPQWGARFFTPLRSVQNDSRRVGELLRRNVSTPTCKTWGIRAIKPRASCAGIVTFSLTAIRYAGQKPRASRAGMFTFSLTRALCCRTSTHKSTQLDIRDILLRLNRRREEKKLDTYRNLGIILCLLQLSLNCRNFTTPRISWSTSSGAKEEINLCTLTATRRMPRTALRLP